MQIKMTLKFFTLTLFLNRLALLNSESWSSSCKRLWFSQKPKLRLKAKQQLPLFVIAATSIVFHFKSEYLLLSLLFWFWVWSSSHCILRDNCLHYKGGWGGGDNPNKACFGRRTQFFQKFGNFIRNQETTSMKIFWDTWYISRTWQKKIGTSAGTIFLKYGKKSARRFKFAGWFSFSHCCAQTAFVRTVTPHTTAISIATDRWVELVHFAFPMDITWYLSEEFHLRHKFAYEHIEQKENSLENIIRSQLGTQNIEFKELYHFIQKIVKNFSSQLTYENQRAGRGSIQKK